MSNYPGLLNLIVLNTPYSTLSLNLLLTMALDVGGRVLVASVKSWQGEEIQLQQPQQFIHIQFRRFAGF